MNLFNYEMEMEAIRALITLRQELKNNKQLSTSFTTAASACDILCLIAQAPDHYLGLKLSYALDNHENFNNKEIALMIDQFLIQIEAVTKFQRDIQGKKD